MKVMNVCQGRLQKWMESGSSRPKEDRQSIHLFHILWLYISDLLHNKDDTISQLNNIRMSNIV